MSFQSRFGHPSDTPSAQRRRRHVVRMKEARSRQQRSGLTATFPDSVSSVSVRAADREDTTVVSFLDAPFGVVLLTERDDGGRAEQVRGVELELQVLADLLTNRYVQGGLGLAVRVG